MITVAALGSDSYLLARGQGLKDRLEVVPGTRPGTLQHDVVGSRSSRRRGRRLSRRRADAITSSTSAGIIRGIDIDRSNTATEQCLSAGSQVVVVVRGQATRPEVIVDGVLLHVVHHDDLRVQPTFASTLGGSVPQRPAAPSARDLHKRQDGDERRGLGVGKRMEMEDEG